MTSVTTSYAAQSEIADFAAHGFDADDRIGRTLDRPRSKLVRRLVVLCGIAGAGAATYFDPTIWTRAWTTVAPVFDSLVETARTPPTATPKQALVPESQPTAPAEAATDRAPLGPPVKVATVPVEAPAAVPVTASPPPSTTPEKPALKNVPAAEAKGPVGDAYAAPKAPAGDALSKRAEMAGLHPDVSRAVLARLSDADFKTAGFAINKALAEAADAETFIWPQKAARGTTRFRISFVQGAPADCRRYVVEIAKDGWQTTALPVEKCGVRRANKKA